MEITTATCREILGRLFCDHYDHVALTARYIQSSNTLTLYCSCAAKLHLGNTAARIAGWTVYDICERLRALGRHVVEVKTRHAA